MVKSFALLAGTVGHLLFGRCVSSCRRRQSLSTSWAQSPHNKPPATTRTGTCLGRAIRVSSAAQHSQRRAQHTSGHITNTGTRYHGPRTVAASQRRCRDEGPNSRDLSSAQARSAACGIFFIFLLFLLCTYLVLFSFMYTVGGYGVTARRTVVCLLLLLKIKPAAALLLLSVPFRFFSFLSLHITYY